jgi:hypothetical protein
MPKIYPSTIVGFCAFFLVLVISLPAQADLQSDVQDLENRLDQQQKLIDSQQRALNMQAEEIDTLKKAKTKQQSATTTPKNTPMQAAGTQPKTSSVPAHQPTSAATPSMTPPTAPQAEESAPPPIDILADEGGILSPKGMLTYENTLEYTDTTRNLFTFNGVELAQVVLVGAINANSVQHQIVQETGRLRLGITDRLQADVHVPYVYRNDSLTNTATTTGIADTSSVEGADIGDIDAGLAYQLNDGKEGWPFLIGNLRYKANNADGPYDVPYNANNVATRLPTGTGFQTVEASVTAIKVSDPAVLFGNLGFVYDVPRNIDKNFNETYIGRVNPGDAVNALVGVAFSINQDTSFSLGYKHSYVFPTIQDSVDLASGTPFNSSSGSSQVGALTLGLSYAVTPTTSINFNVEAGVTNDAPDVYLVMRVPFQLGRVF